jgi:DNA primase
MSNESAVEEIKNRIDIVELVSDYVALKRAGQNFKGLCPFHPEKTPSFMVSSPKQIFHCFGCGAGGDIFGFIMKYENLTFPEALELLAKRAGVELKPRKPGERGLKDTIKAVNLEVQAYFKKSLSASKHATEYLKKRGINQEALGAFGLGFAPDSWHALSEHLKRKGFKEPAIQKAGLTATGQKGPYDIFRGRVTFPILDMHGDVIAFGGRVMGKGEPKYLNSPDTPVFHKRNALYALYQAKDAMREAGEAVVAEGYLDAIMCHQHGIKNVVAPLGTALTPEHVRILKRYASSVVLVFDGDAAGVAAAKRSIELMLSEGTGVRVLLLPEGEDPDSILNKKGAEHFREILSQALSPVDFMLKTSREEKTGTIKETLRVIGGVKDPILRDELLGELSDRTGTRELTLREELKRQSLRPGRPGARTGEEKASKTRGAMAYNEEVLLLSAAISVPDKAAEITGRLQTEDIKDSLIRDIFGKIRTSEDEQAPEVAGDTDEEKALISRLSLDPGFDTEEVDRVIDDCLLKIERRHVDEEIAKARRAGDMALLNRLLGERQKLIQEAR